MNKSILQCMNEWELAINNHSMASGTDPEDLPEDIKDTVLEIRQVLIDNGIDPEKVYPIEIVDELHENSIDGETTITLKYDYYIV